MWHTVDVEGTDLERLYWRDVGLGRGRHGAGERHKQTEYQGSSHNAPSL